MTTLAADTPRTYELGDTNELPVIASDIIYEGAAVGDDSNGNMRPLQAGDPFRGFAEQNVDNAAGAAGAKRVRLKERGKIVLAVTGVTAITDVGKDVFASDDNTFTLTQSTNTRIGRIVRWISGTSCVVEFEAAQSTLAELVDNSGGTPSGTLAAIEGTYTEATIENTVASLAAKINAIIRRLGN
jgi:hypothetical protein